MNLRCFAAGVLAGVVLGLGLFWKMWHQPPIVEGEAIERQLPSGAVLMQRDPQAEAPKEVNAAARESGGMLERAIHLTVQPKSIPALATTAPPAPYPPVAEEPERPAPGCTCAPVELDLGLVRMPDDTRRVVARAHGGEILSALDIPIGPTVRRAETRWSAGLTYDALHREFGAFLDRDISRVRFGFELQQRFGGVAAILRAGVRF